MVRPSDILRECEALTSKPVPLINNGIRSPLKLYRVDLGLSLKEASARLGISQRVLLRLENNKQKIPKYLYIMLAAGCLSHKYSWEQFKKTLESNYGSDSQSLSSKAVTIYPGPSNPKANRKGLR